jgi:uncharacterized membrane protein
MDNLGYMASATLFVIWVASTYGMATSLLSSVPGWLLIIGLAVFWFIYGFIVNKLNERYS